MHHRARAKKLMLERERPDACHIATEGPLGLFARRLFQRRRMPLTTSLHTQWFGYVFVADDYRGTPVETDEAKPFWVPIDAIPYAEMWEDDRIWLPEILARRPVRGDFLFASGKLLSHVLRAWREPVIKPVT